MNNVILFPGLIRLEDGLWHGCRRYRHVGEVKVAVWDLRRMLHEGFSPRTARRHRGMTGHSTTMVAREAQNSEETA
jgi:hypothetical protein